MPALVTSVVVLIVWLVGRSRVPLSLAVGVWATFGSRVTEQSWQIPSPWRVLAGIIAGWATYEFATLLKIAFDNAWNSHRGQVEEQEGLGDLAG